MSTTVIAGRFQQQDEVEHAMDELLQGGFAREHISAFYVNPAGQHSTYPIGGDRVKSPGAEEAGKGIAAGAAVGAAVGAVTAPILGPIGPVTGGLVGAHVGGLVGTLSNMKEEDDVAEESETEQPIRKSGLLIAVSTLDHEQEERAIRLLRAAGASELERAQGSIENGDWRDFNPLAPPELIESLL